MRHQRTAPFAPWQNGRIERLFRTAKEALGRRAGENDGAMAPFAQGDLDRIRAWYNHLRPHQGLDGLTPAGAWSGKRADRRRRPRWIEDWGEALAGYYWSA